MHTLDFPQLASVEHIERGFESYGYICSRKIATAVFLAFQLRKPVLVEETFPLECSPAELERVMEGSRDKVSGWVGFYWGQTEEECRRKGTIAGGITAGWLELFHRKAGK